MKTKHYSKEFQLQAVRLVVEQGYTYAQVAQCLGDHRRGRFASGYVEQPVT